MKSKVAVVKGEDRKENIKNALNLLKEDLREKIKGDVLIKPNFLSPVYHEACTHVDAVSGVLEFIRHNCKDCRVKIGEGTPRAKTGYKNFGYNVLSKEFTIPLLDLSQDDRCIDIFLKNTEGEPVSARLLEAAVKSECRISVAVPKMHDIVPVTLSLKNMMGFLKREDMIKMHGIETGRLACLGLYIADIIGNTSPITFEFIRKLYYLSNLIKLKMFKKNSTHNLLKSAIALTDNLIIIAGYIAPHISVIDGYSAMEGNGPLYGNKVDLKTAIVSADFVAADAVGAKVMGIDPMEIDYIYQLHKQGFGIGELDSIEIVGDSIRDAARTIKRHPDYDIQTGRKADFLEQP